MSTTEEAGRRLDLSSCSVFVDFDGTISRQDVGIAVLEQFASGWEEVDGRYERGEIGSREYVRALWPLLDGAEMADLLAAARRVPLDPGFGPLVAYLRANGAEVTVVSDGIGFYVATRVAAFGVDVMANAHKGRRARFPFACATCPCGLCGTCKATPVSAARRRGRTTVVIGDGTSDRFAAAAADLVFAKGRLVDWCEASATAFTPYGELADVEAALRRRRPPGRE
ncbi:MAG: HAD-IB family phosphatase [Acidimicrobiales bacterium]